MAADASSVLLASLSSASLFLLIDISKFAKDSIAFIFSSSVLFSSLIVSCNADL